MNPRSVKVRQEMNYYCVTHYNDQDLVDLVVYTVLEKSKYISEILPRHL